MASGPVSRLLRFFGHWVIDGVWCGAIAGLLMWGAMSPGINWGLIAAGTALYVAGYIVAKKYEKRTAPADTES